MQLNQLNSCCIFLDFAKAFNTVNHRILLDKLPYNGIRDTIHDWFKSYLSNRQQCVQINGHLSDFAIVKHGVPQGSILGPLLFLLYINDIVKTSSKLEFLLFADDGENLQIGFLLTSRKFSGFGFGNGVG